MLKGAFVFGAQYGQGVVTCRTGHGWSAPVFIRMAGGSFGFQIGGQATDLVLVAVNDRGMQDLLRNKFKIGGDASAAAGPVGRAGQAATDWKMNAELLSYSRNKGVFAGIGLDGTSVSQNKRRHRDLLRRAAELRSCPAGQRSAVPPAPSPSSRLSPTTSSNPKIVSSHNPSFASRRPPSWGRLSFALPSSARSRIH